MLAAFPNPQAPGRGRGALAALAALALGASSAWAQPSRDISTYVLFASLHLDFKGRDANSTRGFISGGDIGVNQVDAHDPPTPNMSMGGGGCCHAVVLSDGTQVVSDTARLDSDSNLYDLYVNRLVGGSAPVVRHTGPSGFSAPILALPALPAFSAGSVPVIVQSNTTQILSPGDYGDIQVKDDGTITLLSGTYNVKSISCGRRVVVNTFNGTVVRIAEDLQFNNQSFVGNADDVQFLLRSDNVASNNSTVSFGRNTTFHGGVYAPNGQINLGHTTDLFGHFWAKEISSDWNVNINKPSNPTTAATPTTWSHAKVLYRD